MHLSSPLPYYVDKIISQVSSTAAQRLEAAVHGRVFFNSFEVANIDFKNFDWINGSSNRNWWWQLQQLPFIKWYIQSIGLYKEKNVHESLIEFIYEATRQWRDCEKVYKKESPLIWHDHGAALRLKNLADMYVALYGLKKQFYLQIKSSSFDEFLEILSVEIDRHVAWLIEDKNYSRRTNHGFEQADILLRITLIFPECKSLKQAGKISKERLLDEISFAFTEQGVHKENSPGYHQFMLTKLKSLSDYHNLGEHELANFGQQRIEKANIFLRAISLPDGTLPLIGDTRGGEKANLNNSSAPSIITESSEISENLRIWDYANSGYIIVDYIDEQSQARSKLIVRSGEYSHYHRHDDDLSIYWQIGNSLILGDGGLFSHNEKDKKRRFVRSSKAHNTLFISGVDAERKMRAIPQKAQLHTKDNPNRIIATTYCFKKWKLRRVVNIEKLKQGLLLIEDQAFKEGSTAIAATNWFFPKQPSSLVNELGKFQLKLNNNSLLTISPLTTSVRVNIYNGWMGEEEHSAVASTQFGVIDDATRITTYWDAPGKIKTRLKISFDN